MSELKREWFEPGPDCRSKFEIEYNLEYDRNDAQLHSAYIAAAFRALLAEEDAAPGELGKAVSVLEVERLTAELRACKDELMAAEIERDAADEFVKQLTAERDALQVRLEASELRAKLLEKAYDEQHEAMRDKEGRCMELQARIEALANLVRRAYKNGFTAGLDDYLKADGGVPWFDSKAKQELARIMEDD